MENLPTKLDFSQHLQTTFHLDHGADEAVPLKLIEVLVNSDHNGLYYEAVFNRSV